MPRQVAAIVHRLRLGFPCWKTISGEIVSCEYCTDISDEPLKHYLLECPATERVRTLVSYQSEAMADFSRDR